MRMKIKGLSFVRTCEASLEQYDVYKDGKQVGYVRLRWGGLTCYCPDYGGDIVYEATIGDGEWTGSFTSEPERLKHLKKMAKAIIRHQENSESD